MQIVIDIPDDVYSVIVKQYRKDKKLQTRDNLYKAIANGTPLPKGHGDLIDRSNIYKATYADEDNLTGIGMTLEEIDEYNNGIDAMYALVRGAKPVIEADKE